MTVSNLPPSISTVLKRVGSGCQSLCRDERQDRLWWADPVRESAIARHDAGPPVFRVPLHDAVYAVCGTATGGLLLGLSKRLCIVDVPPRSGRRPESMRPLAIVDAVDPRIVISNGRADRSGMYVFGTRNVASDGRPIGSFFQFSERHGLRRLAIPTVVSASSICFSQDGNRMVFADRFSHSLYQCRYDAESAGIADISILAQVPDAVALADALVDADDCIWSAQQHAGGGMVVQYDAVGTVRQVIPAGPLQPTGIAIGGAGLDRLMLLGDNGSLHVVDDLALRGTAESLFSDAAGGMP